MELSFLLDEGGGKGGTTCCGNLWLLFLRAIARRPHPHPLPECRHGGTLVPRHGLSGAATCGLDRSLRTRTADPPGAGPGGGGVVAVQSRGVSSSVSGLVCRDGARDQ